jgi:N-acetylgalactosamine-6-sulfatase
MRLIATLCTLLFITSGLCAADSLKPNIILIYADDWGWGDLGSHGNTWLKTPHLDKFAQEGTDFRQFNVLNPVCSPSRATALTGRYPARYSIHQHFAAPSQNARNGMPDWLDARAPTIPRLLKAAGYATAHFGKWHLTNRDTHGAPAPSAYGYDVAKVFNGGAEWPSADLHATAPDTAEFIKAHADRPFFINVWLHESHTPHVPTKASMEKWKHLDPQKQVYAAVITDGDEAVGQIMAALKEAKVDERTLVIFSSDNGPEWTGRKPDKAVFDKDAGITGYDKYHSVGETGGLRGRKRSLFEGGIRVPCLVRWPGHTPAGIINTTTALTAADFLPTFCAAAGVTLPADQQGDGENLLGAFNGEPMRRVRPIFWEWRGNAQEPDWWPRLGIREGDWKLLMTADGTRTSLHRIPEDAAEAKDLSAVHPEIVSRLKQQALAWQATLPLQPDPACISKDRTEAPPVVKKPAVKAAPKVTPQQRVQAFVRWDTDKDGILTLSEYQAGLKGQTNIETRFKSFDRDGDGKLTFEEFTGLKR